MTTRLAAYQGMPYWEPLMLPGSASPGSHCSLPRSRTDSSVRSSRASLSAYWATWVLPTSMMSGPLPLSSAAMTFFPMPVHSWKVTSSSTDGLSFSYEVVNRFRKSSETLSCISQIRTVRVSDPVPGITPQPVSVSAETSATDRARKFFTAVTFGERARERTRHGGKRAPRSHGCVGGVWYVPMPGSTPDGRRGVRTRGRARDGARPREDGQPVPGTVSSKAVPAERKAATRALTCAGVSTWSFTCST